MPRLIALLIVALALGLPFWWFERETQVPAPPQEIIGEVRDDSGPVAGAVVRIKGGPVSVTSDELGRFRLPQPTPGSWPRITAAKDGYFIAGNSTHHNPLILRLSPLPAEDCERYAWVDPTPDPRQKMNCGNCHRAVYDEWNRSGHAHAATNRRFLDLYADLVKEHPLGADVCSSCHAPTQKPGSFGSFDIRDAAKESVGLSGVHCDYCHKVQGAGSGEFGLTHGRYQLSLLRPDPTAERNQLFFGPLDDVDRGDDVHSRFQRDSRLCAACHEGVVFGVPVYSTYSEWLASPAGRSGKSCQSCHMTPTGTMTNIAPGHGGVRRDPATLGNHRFFDGSQLDMLRRCLKLDASAKRTSESVKVNVVLSVAKVGHRVPTGFIDRQLILFVEAFTGDRAVTDYHGPALSESLGPDEAGRPGRLYARVLTNGKDSTPLPFWKGDPATLTDTRLTPGQTDRMEFQFPAEADRVRIRLVQRRFWKTAAQAKAWPPDELVIIEQVLRPE